MPRKQIYQKETILQEAHDLVTEKGWDSLNARSLATRIGSSTQPLFSCFKNMAEIQDSIKNDVSDKLKSDLEKCKDIKTYSLTLLKFTSDFPNWFLVILDGPSSIAFLKDTIDKNSLRLTKKISSETSLNIDESNVVFLENWIFSYGLSSLIAKKIIPYNKNAMESLIESEYESSISASKKSGSKNKR